LAPFPLTRQGEWRLLDGDKIAALLASFVGEELRQAMPPLEAGEGIAQMAVVKRPVDDC